jgi:serine/threonine protein kinase
MADLIGHQLGNYRLVRHLGHGGFAEVYLGEHLYLKSEAALKVLRTSPKEEEMQRFLREAQTLVGLRHPNIVRVLEFGVEGDNPFLVIDYAPGGTVRYRYPSGSRLPLTTTVAYVKQVAAALQYAHNRGIIHRDVKPENILLDFDQQVLLSDFGLALFAPSPVLLSTQEGAGTALYISPEQLQGKPTFASDQYSLGIVTYEWLCGKPPFEGNYWALINQHMQISPVPLRQICPELPDAVESVVLRALAKDPKQRFVSVQAYALALERTSRENTVAPDIDSQVTAPLIPITPSSESTPRTLSPHGPQVRHRVFLTSAPADGAFSIRLQADLQARGILVSNDHLAYVPDANRQDTLRQVIRDANIALVVVSPHTRSSRTLKEQLRIIGMYQRHLVFVWAAGDDVASVLPETWGRTAMIDLVDARETHYRAALDEIIAFLEEETPVGTTEEPTLPVPPGEPRNPYKGLRAFTSDDAADFFGRDALIEELAGTIEGFLMAEKPNTPASRLLAVLGPSGSGKSSVVMAGLLPALQKSVLPGSEAWIYLDPIEPGKRPLESLILAFAPYLPDRSLRAIRHDLEDDSARGLHLLATQLVKRPGVKVMLTIDQFEELFTQTLSEQERQHFIDLLVAAVTEPHGPLIVLLTLRADFYDRPMQYPQLSQLIEAHHTSVLPMNPHELRAVIEQPAVLPNVQLLFEGNLVGDLLFEAQGQAGALPLLEFTLDQLFLLRDGHWLTRRAYQQIGGVKGALAKHAESTYASLPSEEHRRLARALFLRLIDPGVTEQDTTRRRASLEELSLPDSEQTQIIRQVADSFVAARLLMTNEVAETTTIEVSHEALIREWTRLTEWLREARGDIDLQQTISEDAAEWEQRGMPRARLYRGSQLKEASTWAKRNMANQKEVAFLQASTRRRVQSVFGVIIVALLLLSTTAVAVWVLSHPPVDTTYVTNRQDDGLGSLRQAITTAPEGATIKFDPSLRGTIRLTRDLNIDKRLTILGPGARNLAISNDSRSFIIYISPSASVSIFNLAFENSTIKPGSESTFSFIQNDGTLSLTNSVISGNRASGGNTLFICAGGVFNSGTLTLFHTIVTNNSVSGGSAQSYCAGGILNVQKGRLNLIDSTVSDNSVSGDGSKSLCSGGILNFEGATLVLTNSTVSGNSAYGGRPGSECSGGIYNDAGMLILTNSTVSDNTTAYNGGGIFSYGGRANITFCTIYRNKAQEGGGSYFFVANTSSDSVMVRNSIIAGNNALNAPDIAGRLNSGGYNLIQNSTGADFVSVSADKHLTDISGDQFTNLGIDPTLRDNGGSTRTHRLLQGSPAIDAIPLAACNIRDIFDNATHKYIDQRGVQRPQGKRKRCDIGAYEFESAT